MKMQSASLLALFAALSCGAAFAQTAAQSDVQRDVDQQKRIEQGLKSGELNTKEAGRLEREQQVINRTEARDLKDGRISAGEQQQLNREKRRANQDIYRAKHNAATGNPDSASSQRLQADVGRNINQQKRIERGMQTGQMTNHEAAYAEAGQSRSAGREASAARNGRVTAGEQARIQKSESSHSRGIYRKKHNAKTK
ncbi:MAG TPA: hypothetical protein VFB36_16235 [Nevskiaceae bacterium]|nr:hypothetical protein [Nevskiaceae bacterium]